MAANATLASLRLHHYLLNNELAVISICAFAFKLNAQGLANVVITRKPDLFFF